MGESLVHRVLRGVWRTRCDADWTVHAPADGNKVMTADILDRLHVKQGRSIARWTLGHGDDSLIVYVKRHYRGSWFSGMVATLFPSWRVSAAFQEASRIDWASANGFRVPRVVAAGERIGPWGSVQSYLALEELTGMIALHEAIPLAATQLGVRDFQSWKRGLTRALARDVARLHGCDRYHKDLYLCHFFLDKQWTKVAPTQWHGQLAMIDLHRLGHHPWTGPWWKLKDLAQLLYSTNVRGITARDRLRFARYYAGRHRRSWRWKLLSFLVGIRWRNYERHNRELELSRAA